MVSDVRTTQMDALSERFITDKEAVALLNELGLGTSIFVLRKLRVVGGGPRFRKFGRLVRYSPSAVLEWAHNRLSAEVSSTTELSQQRYRDLRGANP